MGRKGKGEVVNQLRARVYVEAGKQGLTITSLAERIGVTRQALHKLLERGKPNMTSLTKIASALGLAPVDLMRPVSAGEYGEAKIPRA